MYLLIYILSNTRYFISFGITMHRVFRNLFISLIVVVCWLALYQLDVVAEWSGDILTGTSYTLLGTNIFLTSVNISSNNSANTNYARSWDIVTLIFTGSEELTWIHIIINGEIPTSVSWSWISRTAMYVVPWWTSDGELTFSIDYSDIYNNSWNTNTGTTDDSSVFIDNTIPTADVLYTNVVSGVQANLKGISENISDNTDYLFTGNGSHLFIFHDFAGNTWSVRANVIINMWWNITSTWSTDIWWATATGILFTTTGTLNVISPDISNNVLSLNISWFSIHTLWWSWDKILVPPTNLSAENKNNATLARLWLDGSTNTVLLTIQVWSTTDSLIASGWYFTISFVLSAGTIGDTIKLYRSEDWKVWTTNTPDTTCILDSHKICTFRTDHLSYFGSVKTTTSNWGWGGGGWWWGWVWNSGSTISWAKDNCPNGDKSPSVYDGVCTAATTGTISITSWWSIVGSKYSKDLNKAYLYAYKIGITTIPTIQQANMEWNLLRSHMAKMMVNYAMKILGLVPNTFLTCEFKDINNQTAEMKNYMKLACQLWLMGVGIDNFYPWSPVTRAEFWTVFSRALWGNMYNESVPYYLGHLNALKQAWVMSKIDTPSMKELRGYVMLMLMRANK